MNNIKRSTRNTLESGLPLTFQGFLCVRPIKVNESYPCNPLGTGGRIVHLISTQMAPLRGVPDLWGSEGHQLNQQEADIHCGSCKTEINFSICHLPN